MSVCIMLLIRAKTARRKEPKQQQKVNKQTNKKWVSLRWMRLIGERDIKLIFNSSISVETDKQTKWEGEKNRQEDKMIEDSERTKWTQSERKRREGGCRGGGRGEGEKRWGSWAEKECISKDSKLTSRTMWAVIQLDQPCDVGVCVCAVRTQNGVSRPVGTVRVGRAYQGHAGVGRAVWPLWALKTAGHSIGILVKAWQDTIKPSKYQFSKWVFHCVVARIFNLWVYYALKILGDCQQKKKTHKKKPSDHYTKTNTGCKSMATDSFSSWCLHQVDFFPLQSSMFAFLFEVQLVFIFVFFVQVQSPNHNETCCYRECFCKLNRQHA